MSEISSRIKLTVISLLFSLCGWSQSSSLEFVNQSIDCGKIKKGVELTRNFEFQNTGKAPVKIARCSATCRCTVPFCPQNPINPGEKSKVTVTYDTSKEGEFDKKITVYTEDNVNNIYILTISGDVRE